MSKRPSPADFPEIALLLSGYFHQDWMLYGSSESVIDGALDDFRKEQRAALLRELTTLLTEAEDDSVLKAVLNNFPLTDIGFQRAKDAGTFARMLHHKLVTSLARD